MCPNPLLNKFPTLPTPRRPLLRYQAMSNYTSPSQVEAQTSPLSAMQGKDIARPLNCHNENEDLKDMLNKQKIAYVTIPGLWYHRHLKMSLNTRQPSETRPPKLCKNSGRTPRSPFQREGAPVTRSPRRRQSWSYKKISSPAKGSPIEWTIVPQYFTNNGRFPDIAMERYDQEKTKYSSQKYTWSSNQLSTPPLLRLLNDLSNLSKGSTVRHIHRAVTL